MRLWRRKKEVVVAGEGDKKVEMSKKVAEKKAIKFAELLRPMLTTYVHACAFRTVNPKQAYFWLRSSNAHLFAEAMAKDELKLMLDYLRPLKMDWIKYTGIVLIILAFALAVVVIWSFTHGGQAPSVPPSVQPHSTPVVIK